ncbi:MAG: AI-2E family transporter [Bdellovibrionaceae bacterium]|nr:AI-2E family transporter [Pseudobdellovibrionaceae bacterium]
MSDTKLASRLRRERWLKLSAFLAIHSLALVLLFTIDNLLVSFVLAFVINYLLAPLVSYVERKRIPRHIAILIPFVTSGLIIGLAIYLVLPLVTAQITSLEAQLPIYQRDLLALIGRIEMRIKGLFNLHEFNVAQNVNTWLIAKTGELSTLLPSIISQSLTVALLAPFLAYFMLQDGRSVSRSLLAMVPNNLFELALNLHHQINEQMGGFIRARFLEAAIVGLVVWAGLAIIGFPYAPLLSIFAALMNLIPYVGPILGAVPAVLIALISEDGAIYSSMSLNLFVLTSVFFIAQLIDVLFIIPFVVARIVNLHPVTVILVIIIGAQLMGILGMVISIPVASVLKLTLTAVYNHLLEFRS